MPVRFKYEKLRRGDTGLWWCVGIMLGNGIPPFSPDGVAGWSPGVSGALGPGAASQSAMPVLHPLSMNGKVKKRRGSKKKKN